MAALVNFEGVWINVDQVTMIRPVPGATVVSTSGGGHVRSQLTVDEVVRLLDESSMKKARSILDYLTRPADASGGES